MSLDRREFIKLTGGSIAASLSVGMLGGCESILEQINNRPIRKNISTLSDTDPIIQAYKDGVSAMKALSSTDRRNWTAQADIHNDFCPHGNWYFLPWHRAYLYYFEAIIRELSGYQDFALPYWNWTCQPSIPGVFFGSSNTLNDTTRTKGATDIIPTSYTGEDVMDDIFDLTDFESFGSYESGGFGELEGTPHNLVHGWIDGNMSEYMSPLDPVFWCHHNMVERCWWEWNITRGNPNPDSSDWYDLSLGGMFCDKDGNLINNITVGTTSLMPLLSYQYDDQVIPCSSRVSGFKAIPERLSNDDDLREFLKKGGPYRIKTLDRISSEALSRVVIRGGSEKRITIPTSANRMLKSNLAKDSRYLLKVNKATLTNASDVFVRVFVNSPSGAVMRDKDDLHYAGSFAFFGSGEHAHHSEGNTYYIDITNTVKRLRRKGLIKDDSDIDLSFVAVSIADGKSIPQGGVEISNAEILRSEAKPN